MKLTPDRWKKALMMMMQVLMISNTKMFKNAHVKLNAYFNIAVLSYKYFLIGIRVHLIMALYIISYPHMYPLSITLSNIEVHFSISQGKFIFNKTSAIHLGMHLSRMHQLVIHFGIHLSRMYPLAVHICIWRCTVCIPIECICIWRTACIMNYI